MSTEKPFELNDPDRPFTPGDNLNKNAPLGSTIEEKKAKTRQEAETKSILSLAVMPFKFVAVNMPAFFPALIVGGLIAGLLQKFVTQEGWILGVAFLGSVTVLVSLFWSVISDAHAKALTIKNDTLRFFSVSALVLYIVSSYAVPMWFLMMALTENEGMSLIATAVVAIAGYVYYHITHKAK